MSEEGKTCNVAEARKVAADHCREAKWSPHICDEIEAGKHDGYAVVTLAERITPPAALREQACLIGLSGKVVTVECDTRGEAEALFEWLSAR